MTNKKIDINEEDFTRYLEDKITGTERNAFEKKLQKQPFETEALEGLNTIAPDDFKNDLHEIKAITKPRNRKNNYRYLAAAASVLLVVTAGVIWIQVKDQNIVSEMAEIKTIEKKIELEEISDKVSEPSQNKKETKETTNSEITPQIEKRQKRAVLAKELIVEDEPFQKPDIEKSVIIREVTQPAATDETLMITDNNLDFGKPQNVSRNNMFAQQNKKAQKQIEAESYQVSDAAPIGVVMAVPEAEANSNSNSKKEIVNIEAHPEGGLKSFQTYLDSTAILPRNYSKRREVVKIEFEIDSLGTLGNFKNKNSADSLLFSKTKEIILNGPVWFPEIKDGKRINSNTVLKVVFRKK